MAVTLKELARMANTSVTTVSRVLNNKPGISQERRESILKLANRLGYQPNLLARNLVMQKNHIIGFIASSLTNPVYVEFFRLIDVSCRSRGYQVLIADSEGEAAREKENVELMLQHQAEGLLVFPVSDMKSGVDLQHFLDLQLRKVPFVVVGETKEYNFDCVTSEEVKSSAVLARHLLEFGHRRFGIVGEDEENRCAKLRIKGFVDALQESGVVGCNGFCKEDLRITGSVDQGGVQDAMSWFDSDKPPTALLTMNDMIALELYRPLGEKGIRIPEDVSIVTFENDFWSELVKPSLTTSAPDYPEVARLAFETLMGRVDNPRLPPQIKKVPQKFIVRESSGSAPV